MKSLFRGALLIFEAVRSFLVIVVRFFLWSFTNRVTATITTTLLIILSIWIAGFFYYVSQIKQSRQEIVSQTEGIGKKTDAIVVLTGGSERIKHAIHLLTQRYANKLFISGVNKDVKLREILLLLGYKESDTSVFEPFIDLGYSAEDTMQNATEIVEWVEKNNIKSVRLVTSNYHIKRAELEVSNKLPDDVILIPHSVLPLYIRIDKWWGDEPSRTLLISEYNKYVAAQVRIAIQGLGLK